MTSAPICVSTERTNAALRARRMRRGCSRHLPRSARAGSTDLVLLCVTYGRGDGGSGTITLSPFPEPIAVLDGITQAQYIQTTTPAIPASPPRDSPPASKHSAPDHADDDLHPKIAQTTTLRRSQDGSDTRIRRTS